MGLVHSNRLGSYKRSIKVKTKKYIRGCILSDYGLGFIYILSFTFIGDREGREGTNNLGGDRSIDSCRVGWRLGLCVGEYCLSMW